MEFLNKVELKGIVGSVHNVVFGLHPAKRFSLVTEHTSKDADGRAVIETTWFNCTYTPADNEIHAEIAKGDKVHLIGRLRARSYTDQDNNPHYVFEVVVREYETIVE